MEELLTVKSDFQKLRESLCFTELADGDFDRLLAWVEDRFLKIYHQGLMSGASTGNAAINVYTRWKGQTSDEIMELYRIAGWPSSGKYGCLREELHGDPYATEFLFAEAFENPFHLVHIPVAVLKSRLKEALGIINLRGWSVYKFDSEPPIEEWKKCFSEFVTFCEQKEQETGEAVKIVVHN